MKSFKDYFVDNVIDYLCIIWTFLQDTVGFLTAVITNCVKEEVIVEGKRYTIYIARRFNKNWSGVSLGDYIIFADYKYADDNSVKHEFGHQKQSFYLGPLYLVVVGVPSVVRNVYDRFAHGSWNNKERIIWSYGGYPEKWADKLGNVQRKY